MITSLYAIVATAAIVALFMIPVVDALSLDDWARTTWLRSRFRDRAGLNGAIEEPPRPWRSRIYLGALILILGLFFVALVLPR